MERRKRRKVRGGRETERRESGRSFGISGGNARRTCGAYAEASMQPRELLDNFWQAVYGGWPRREDEASGEAAVVG